MDQFKNITEWKNQWDQFFGEEFWNNFEPYFDNSKSQLNIYQAENELLVVLSLPGLARVDDVDIYVQYQTLSVKGKINLNFKGYEIIQEGIIQGKIEREIQLPFAVREDRIDASYKRGLLIIHLHKLIPDETRKKITVKDEDR
ncbi:Hsp20/alpha crystallin family protein [Ferdinandcohnia quinoae]|uniref:Hsp20/alpha crystallin family protein n=1 Tax=Fredinandcohnia quinoae TaxID=2918902 RepID=A0AAW5DXA7_9BACI|nr:Hsp20/alpha crystallin family protein [Fredinandcohnia sp. SECRCQ15]MCH1624688.1 Hsp20/alpha crystallin family protein [Fredinandcohnia sp. SECRCQ15]